MLGISDRIVEHGSPKELHKECAYDAQAIATAARLMVERCCKVCSTAG